jgi:hypothetical protein
MYAEGGLEAVAEVATPPQARPRVARVVIRLKRIYNF